MKILDIAFKDILRSFRSTLSMVMMFVVPIMIPGIIYAAFGGSFGGSGSGFNLPVTHVVVANLDRGEGQSAGAILTTFLQSKDLSQLLDTSVVADEAAARDRVNNRQANVAVIIPADFSQAAFAGKGTSNITLYHDPTLTVGPLIVKQFLAQFADAFSGARIAVNAAAQSGTLDAAALQNIGLQYGQWAQSNGQSSLIDVQAPPGKSASAGLGGIMVSMTAGMLIFFAFYTGAVMAQTILKEEEEGTLPRLFTTPTSRATILGGKFTAIFLMLIVQVLVLMLVGGVLFKLQWGDPATLAVAIIGLVVSAAGFGLFLMSFIKNARQAGPIMGGVLSVLAMVGGLFSLFMPNLPAFLDQISLFTPQGWVMRSWKLALNGAAFTDVVLPVVVAVVIGIVLFGIGTFNFRKRFA
jgi:ABC-2 type transport system permease protein